MRPFYHGPMRWARSYSIIDHQILHGRYLHRLSHESMVLYLFLVVVGDRRGRSFYSDRSIMEILRLSSSTLHHAREELLSEELISYRRPYWEVNNITQGRTHGRDAKRNDPLPSGRPGAELLSDPRPDRDVAKACLAHLSKILSGEKNEEVHAGSIPVSHRGMVQGTSDLKSPASASVVTDQGGRDQLPRRGEVHKILP
jgi:hypothetical protein